MYYVRNNPLSIIIAITVFPLLIAGQSYPCDLPSPAFTIKKIELPNSPKHKAITGYLPKGRLLLQCTNEADLPPDKKATRQFWEVSQDKDGNISHKKSRLDLPGELATLDDSTIFYTVEMQGKRYFRLANLGQDGGIVLASDKSAPLDWDKEVRNPFIFKLSYNSPSVLIFSARADGRNDQDLFISEILSASTWTKPRRLENPAVNSPFDERYPTVGSDGTLYFCSNRPGSDCYQAEGGGKLDPWRVFPDFNKYWRTTAASPLPAPLASKSEERALFSVWGSPGNGFFISNREDGKQMELYTYETEGESFETIEPTYYALVIGVSGYKALDILPNPVPNARQLTETLEKRRGFRVKLLENPTSEEILDHLSQYGHLQPNDYLLVTFFGHGIAQPDVQSPQTCLLAGKDGKADGSNCITPDAFQDRLLRNIQNPRHVLVILDACFGGLFKPQVLRGEFDNDSRKLLASTKGDWVPDESCFLTFLMEKLNEGYAFNGQQLFNHIYDGMKNSPPLSPCRENSPSYFDLPGSKGGDFPFPAVIKH